jgi:hypothetical protein
MRMVGPSDAAPDLDVYTEGTADVLPFLTSARVVRCLSCDRLMYASDYVNANHACIPAGQFAGVDLDSQVSA